jgi:S1-C subfamily serine protease
MSVLRELSAALAESVAGAASSVVRVEGHRKRGGTGVAWSQEGVIVTADHVLEGDAMQVGLPEGQVTQARVVGRDPSSDLAVLRIEGFGAQPAPWGDLEDVRVGHLVLALGRPGQTIRARLGIVSVLGEGWRLPGGGEVDRYLESDVGVVPGFSGGPLLDVQGKVLGINTAVLPGRRTITIPAGTVQRVVQALLAHGRIPRGYLGVGVQPVNLPDGLRRDVQQDGGLLVIAVEPGSPADHAGLMMGDTIAAVDGVPVDSPHGLRGALSGERIGASVSVRVVRAGKVHDVTVVVGERMRKTA